MYEYRAYVKRVYDGDTITVMADVGFNTYRKLKVRLSRVDTPEIRTRNKIEKAKGYEAKGAVVKMVNEHPDEVYIQTLQQGTYRRSLPEVWISLMNLSSASNTSDSGSNGILGFFIRP